jgi:hypothetical protein
MSERSIQTSCPGIGEYYDTSFKPTKHEIRLFTNIDPLSISVSEDSIGIMSVDCPFYERGRCERISTNAYDLYNRESQLGINLSGPVCRFMPAAGMESFEVAQYPFAHEPHMFRTMWNNLSPVSKTACIYMLPYYDQSINEEMLKSICYVWQIGKAEEREMIVEDVLEAGVFEKVSKAESMKIELEKLGVQNDAVIEDEDIYQQQAEKVLQANYEKLMREWNDPELAQRIVSDMRRSLEGRHMKLIPGFEQFVGQFKDQFGFPLDFTKPRDPVVYMDEEGRTCLKIY